MPNSSKDFNEKPVSRLQNTKKNEYSNCQVFILAGHYEYTHRDNQRNNTDQLYQWWKNLDGKEEKVIGACVY